MIVKSSESRNMICPLGQAHADRAIRCEGDRCMAWRDAGDGRGFCGMCPVSPMTELPVVGEVKHD